MDDDGNLTPGIVETLPVKFKEPPKDKMLFRPWEVGKKTCNHFHFVIDEALDQVECADCGEKLNPMFVLKRLANRESRWMETRRAYQEEMKRLDQRSRTKCQHCGEMTRISNR